MLASRISVSSVIIWIFSIIFSSLHMISQSLVEIKGPVCISAMLQSLATPKAPLRSLCHFLLSSLLCLFLMFCSTNSSQFLYTRCHILVLSQLSVYSSSFLIFLVSLSGLYLFYGVFFSALLCNISMIFRTSGSSIICYSTLTLLSYSCYLLTMIFFFYLGLSLDTCFIEILITL